MINIKYILPIMILITTCRAQQYKLVGACEGCEAIFEFGERKLSAVDTLIDFIDPGPQIKISGTVYKSDGSTPAGNVILYIYHTNQEGIYPTKGDEKGWAKRHGYIRGWMKTDENGRYTFYTLKPGTYPSRSEPAHIHITVLEPNGKYYWLHSYYFADDPLLQEEDTQLSAVRGGGSSILNLKKENNLLVGYRDIILGKNIPGYK
jgi:protocatechuate 3,4-dioxygenase beta subunit